MSTGNSNNKKALKMVLSPIEFFLKKLQLIQH